MSECELVPPTPTGNKATVIVLMELMVEVPETDDYNDMADKAKAAIAKRVLPGKGFEPYRTEVRHIHPDVTVDELKSHLIIYPERGVRK